MKKKILKILAALLIFSICTSLLPSSVLAVPVGKSTDSDSLTLEDFYAGNATAEDLYGKLDEAIVPEIIGYETAVAKNHIGRLYEDEGTDLNKVVFLNADGSKTMYLFDFPVKYMDETGSIQDIRLEIADGTTESGKFQTAANDAVTRFPAKFTDGISLEGNNTEIRLVPVLTSANSGTATMSTNGMTANAVANATAQRIDKNTIEYRYDNKTTVEYSLTYTGFKEDIVVSEYTGQTTYPFRLYTNGLALEEMDGSYYLVDDDGNIKATIGNIIIFTADERNNAFGDIVPTTIVENEEYLLNIVVDADYLADPNTIYPIRIDPTIEINYDNNGGSAIEDITISTNKNFAGSHDSLYVGRRSTEGIARALMRFPGLNLSNLAGATITSATVQLRDLMCESDELAISCHVFTGNVWDANSATWSNVSPNSYVSTAMSANTMSWSIGKTHSPVHWYSFDISPAVQGWIDGNYTQNKGIIFKVNSTVENGSTIANRTFGSYNRASYKPSLSVTYEPKGTQIISNGSYYLNNRGTGKYIQKTTAGTAAGVSGLLSSIGSTVQWQIRKVSNGYVIRSANDPTKYLAVPETSTSSSVSIITVSESNLPTRCVWTIWNASGGGFLVKNVHNNKYLYSSGTSLYTTASTGEYGTTTYETFVWRTASISRYGNTSSYTSRELTDNFSFDELIVNIGATSLPTISDIPSGTLWADVKDFTFTRSSGTSGCVSIGLPGNTVTGTKIGIATYTATHKVTNRSVTFKVYVDRYTYVLTTEFKFNDPDAELIRKFYDRIESTYANDYPERDYRYTAWIASRVLGGLVYDETFINEFRWDIVAGESFVGDDEAGYFTDELGYSSAEYVQLRVAIQGNHSNADSLRDRSDFAHMQSSLSARLAYDQWIVVLGEDVSYLAGWLGDATLGSPTSFGNDDYHADLDAENIFRLISEDCSIIEATNTYYASLTSSNNRADIFLGYIDYETVRSKVHQRLFTWNDETIKATHPDTYNFLKSLQAGLADIYNYAIE